MPRGRGRRHRLDGDALNHSPGGVVSGCPVADYKGAGVFESIHRQPDFAQAVAVPYTLFVQKMTLPSIEYAETHVAVFHAYRE